MEIFIDNSVCAANFVCAVCSVLNNSMKVVRSIQGCLQNIRNFTLHDSHLG